MSDCTCEKAPEGMLGWDRSMVSADCPLHGHEAVERKPDPNDVAALEAAFGGDQGEHDEIIHFAGPYLLFGRIRRQRCLWCGAIIQDYDLSKIGMHEGERKPENRGKPIQADELGHWEGLVAVSGTNPRSYRKVEESPDCKAPDRSCMVLMPDEIGQT